MLIENLYQIQSFNVEESVVTATIHINKDHDIFNGHFPNNPVMPGVCMIQIIKELTEKAFDVELFMEKASNIKFMALINPEENPVLDLNLKVSKEDNLYKVKNTTNFGTTVALKFSGTFKII